MQTRQANKSQAAPTANHVRGLTIRVFHKNASDPCFSCQWLGAQDTAFPESLRPLKGLSAGIRG